MKLLYRDFKYLIAYILPLSVVFAIYQKGFFSFSGVLLGFGILPMLELFFPAWEDNLDDTEEESQLSKIIFDILLYLNVPLLWSIIIYYLHTVTSYSLATYEFVGMTLSTGVICGTIGINVAHELGHRSTWYEQLMAKMLLLSAHYTHFIIEHNRGHHKNVATEIDPASARFNEPVFAFVFRSVLGSYRSAWHLENKRLQRLSLPAFHYKNEMLRFLIVHILYFVTIFLFFSWKGLLAALLIGIVGFVLLETVNYIEHYGLRRKQLPSGRYEPVQPHHSWNSNHELGRIFLYELTRHSDHHYKANRKYQILRHFNESPQLPYGYTPSMLMAWFPPLWFWRMNPLVKHFNQQVNR